MPIFFYAQSLFLRHPWMLRLVLLVLLTLVSWIAPSVQAHDVRFYTQPLTSSALFTPVNQLTTSTPFFRDTSTPDLTCHTPACRWLTEDLANPFLPTRPIWIDQIGCHRSREAREQAPVEGCYQYLTPIHWEGDPRFAGLGQETRNIAILSVGIMLVIFALPEDISNWERSEMKPGMLGDKWIENNQAGPVWDEDDWVINYIGHPYFGAVYYMVARNQGLNQLESFGYSFLMSALWWEMGIEALAEIPSKQDLIITPLIGSVIGEAFYIWEQRILANNREVAGSPALGQAVLFLLNPAGRLSEGMNRYFDSHRWIQEANSYWVIQSTPLGMTQEQGPHFADESWMGLQIELLF
ncbi:DUF3943 domain-containing protein [Marinospirillum sp.]|uniref:DUF3943 domain-containing protein n=1 Tax=Marinospirillum sp. TaxID=2183934 RepID=UPI003A8A8198